jgi:hypothetical protein
MRLFKMALFLVFVLCFFDSSVQAQKTDNAALRYWMSFSLMQDQPADLSMTATLEGVASGSLDWDEERLGSFIDRNMEAIEVMQRATKLPECNWALEYELGADTPVAHLAKGRVLSRLNVLYGLRMAAKGDGTRARESIQAGLRFAQHLSTGSSLFGILTAKTALLADFQGLTKMLRDRSLNAAELEPIRKAILALPETGLDWSSAVRLEAMATGLALKQLANSPNAYQRYQSLFGEPPPGPMPVVTEIAKFEGLMGRAADAMEQSPAQATTELIRVQEEFKKLNPIIKRAIPSLSRVNENREQISAERKRLLATIASYQER